MDLSSSTLKFDAIVPSKITGPYAGSPRWKAEGPNWARGNYRLRYSGRGRRTKLWLQFEGAETKRINVTHVDPGEAIGRPALGGILDVLTGLNAWSVREDSTVRCCLVQTDSFGAETGRSNFVDFKPPVTPWTKGLDPDAFARDPSIYYCSVEFEGEELFNGRELVEIAPYGRFFVFKGILETNPTFRGFACIGFVANILGAQMTAISGTDEKGKDISISTRESGFNLAAVLGGESFHWTDRPTLPTWLKPTNQNRRRFMFSAEKHNVAGTLFDTLETHPGGGYVSMGPRVFKAFIRSPAAHAGTYVVWIKGHCGMVQKGALYECKPSQRGFSPSVVYTPGASSAVCKFESADIHRIANYTYMVSKIPGR